MKTTILNFKLLVIAIGSLLIISCDGEDGMDGAIGPVGPQGEQGIQGEQGPQGEQGEAGQDGADGQDGEDGNVNVTSKSYNVSTASGTSHTFTTKILNSTILSTGVVLVYLNTNEAWYQIPNQRILDNNLSLIDVATELMVGSFTMTFLRDNLPFSISANSLNTVRIVTVPGPSNLLGKSSSERTIDFERDNIDVSDYYEVMDYLGLEY